MPTSVIALEILLILLPGFATAYVVQLLALRGSQTDLDKVIEGALYSFLIYASFTLATGGSLPFDVVRPNTASTDSLIIWHPNRLVGLVLLSAGLALCASIYFNLDGNYLFRIIGVTERTARRSIWNDVFQLESKRSQIVQVELGDKRSLIGVLGYYSDLAEDCSLYLQQASWVNADDELIPIPGPGILLTKNANIQSISLLDPALPTSPPAPSPVP